MRDHRAFLLLCISLVFVTSLAGCSAPADPAPVCLDAGIDPSCTPAYEPSYDALFANTLHPGCSRSGVSCHASSGRQGGLNFDDVEDSFTALQTKVRPGEPGCSVLVHRMISTDTLVRMPPGRALSAGEQCAIVKWIAGGARR